MENYPKPVTKESHNKISDYLNNSIYQIKGNEGKYGIGFFCLLKCNNKTILVLITNYQTVNKDYLKNYDYIDVLINKELIRIKFSYIYYIDKNLDLSVIEIQENKTEKMVILELDEDNYKKESEMHLNKESIYVIENKSVSYGTISNITKSEFIFRCNVNANSYCYPIFNLATNKLIGIYKKNFKRFHKGIFFKYIIEQLKQKYLKKDINGVNDYFNNEIEIEINIDDTDIKNKIFFLDNEYNENDSIKSSHDNLKELNELNTDIYIKKENKETKENYKKYFIPEEKGIYNIKIKFNINLTNCSYMFAGCKKIMNISFILFNTKYIKNMRYMFYGCENLKNNNLLSFNTINCKDMSHMFENCKNLEYLDLSSFRINKIVDTTNMFVGCLKLNEKFLERVEFKELQQLNLSDNKISDIKILGKVNFKELQQLDLSYNKISNINILEKVNLKELQ